MDFYNYLVEKYGYNEPVFIQEITYKDYSKPWIYKQLNKLCNSGKLIRFDKGIYYIPKDTVLGKSVLDPRKVVKKKYIQCGENIIGYYSGNTLLNILNLSDQMPNIMEIYTNNERSKVREISVGKMKVILRRSRITVTNENFAVLQFLELMNFTDASFFDEERKKKVTSFIRNNKITRSGVAEFAPAFPDKAMRNLVESGVIYSVTR